MNWKKFQPAILIAVTVLCIAVAVFLFIVAGKSDAAYKQTLSVICGILFLLLACLFLLYWWLTRDNDPNFFLFIRKERRNMPIEKLTATVVNDRMTFFISQITTSPEQLWSEDILEDERNFGYRNVYKPLVAYKMLYDLSEKKPDSSYWDYLKKATPVVIQSICRTLDAVGEKKFAQYFKYILETYPNDDTKIKNYLIQNNKYLRGRMLSYVKAHIEAFY